MQIHELKPSKRSTKKRVGRGGKRGTYSGKGQKGQKSRSGHSSKPDFRGGDTPIWRKFPKKRGAGKKTDLKKRFFIFRKEKPVLIDLDMVNSAFKDGEVIDQESLLEKKIINSKKTKVKILADGKLRKKVEFKGVKTSRAAKKAIISRGGKVLQ